MKPLAHFAAMLTGLAALEAQLAALQALVAARLGQPVGDSLR